MLMTDLRVSKNKKVAYNKSIHPRGCVFIVLNSKLFKSHLNERKLRFFKLFECKFITKNLKIQLNKKNINKWASGKKKKISWSGRPEGGQRTHAYNAKAPSLSLSFLYLFFHNEEVQPIACSLSKFFISRNTQSSSFFWRCCGTHALTD